MGSTRGISPFTPFFSSSKHYTSYVQNQPKKRVTQTCKALCYRVLKGKFGSKLVVAAVLSPYLHNYILQRLNQIFSQFKQFSNWFKQLILVYPIMPPLRTHMCHPRHWELLHVSFQMVWEWGYEQNPYIWKIVISNFQLSSQVRGCERSDELHRPSNFWEPQK